MNTERTKGRREQGKSEARGHGPAGHGMPEMLKCCTGQGGFPDCLTMMEKMKKRCCTPHKDTAESDRKKK